MTSTTPEVAAYWGAKEEQQATLRTVRRRSLLILLVTAVVVIASVVIFLVKVDSKISHVDSETVKTFHVVSKIRSTQKTNTQISLCVARSVDNQDADVLRALLLHDPNPADYKALKPCLPQKKATPK